ncbi:MAG: ketopantoate reductase family protein [Planctomycetota bacterium]
MQNPIESPLSEWQPKRIAIIGAGAMGSSLAAVAGHHTPVVMVCRNPARAAQIFEHGIQTHDQLDATARPIIVKSISELTAVGGLSAVFVATKTTAIPQVASQLKPILNDISDQPGGVFVVSYQNGIEPGRQLLKLLDYPQVLRMVLNFGAVLHEGDHSVRVTFNKPPHAIGTTTTSYIPVCQKIATLLTDSGFQTSYVEHIEPLVWAKAIVNAAVNPVAALVNSTVEQVMNGPSLRIVDALLEEGVSVAAANGISLDTDYILKVKQLLATAGDHIPSMVEDIRAGRESEIGQLNQQILNYANRLNVDVPTHQIIDALIETFDWKVYHHQKPAIES